MVTESPLRGQWVGAGAGIAHVELERLWRRPQPLATSTMSLDVPFRVPAGSAPHSS